MEYLDVQKSPFRKRTDIFFLTVRTMKVSVALCTYNGEKYVREQILSIASQSQSVDEVVICDDGSVDSTIQIIESLQPECSFPIRLFLNEHSLGVVSNFAKAISICSGDIVFLSDQDDVWSRDKVKTIVDWFSMNPEKSVVFTDAELIDDNGCVIPDSEGLFNAVGFGKRVRRHFDYMALDIFVRYNRATGATMAVRKSFFDDFSIHTDYAGSTLPLHDAQIAYAAICNGGLGFICDKLISYRIHSSQECGLGAFVKNPREEKIYNMFYSNGCLIIPEIEDRIGFLKKKALFRVSPFGKEVLKHPKEYIDHYGLHWFSFFAYDFLHGLKGSLKKTFLN